MPIPNLALLPDFALWAEATGDPANGANAIGLPFVANGTDPDTITANGLKIDVIRLGPSVTSVAAGVPLLSADKQTLNLNFVQAGVDQVTVRVQIVNTLGR